MPKPRKLEEGNVIEVSRNVIECFDLVGLLLSVVMPCNGLTIAHDCIVQSLEALRATLHVKEPFIDGSHGADAWATA